MDRFIATHPDLDIEVAKWRQEHPHGSLVDAVTDLELWTRNPRDRDAQWFVWRRLYDQGDLVARDLGYQAMMRLRAREAS
jgi:hypothetical protein